MWPVIAAFAAIISSLVTWWVANNPRIRERKMLDKIQGMEDDLRIALSKKDMDRVNDLTRDLNRLRDAQTALAGL